MAHANALLRLDRLHDACRCFEDVLASNPDDIDALFGLADTLTRSGCAEEAAAVIDRMLTTSCENAEQLAKCCQLLVTIRHYGAAARGFRRLVEMTPDESPAWGGLANCMMEICDWRDFDAVRLKMVEFVTGGRRVDPLLFVRLCDDPARQLQCARGFASAVAAGWQAPARSPRRSDKIRIAYLSPDFRVHAVAFLAAEVFELHDRARFDLVGLSLGPDDKSEIRSRIFSAFGQIHDVRHETDDEIARLVHRLEVDILVDLGGYTEQGRLGVLARRAAPIQVNYLGYPGTLGAPFVDYIVADPIIAPFDH